MADRREPENGVVGDVHLSRDAIAARVQELGDPRGDLRTCEVHACDFAVLRAEFLGAHGYDAIRSRYRCARLSMSRR